MPRRSIPLDDKAGDHMSSKRDKRENLHLNSFQRTLVLTCEKLLADFESVDQWREDSLDGAEHAAEAEVHQHQEEHDRPEG